MKIYSYKSNPKYEGVTSIGAYHWPSCLILTPISLVKLSGVILIALIFVADTFALTSVFNAETNKDGNLFQDTEAHLDLHAPAWQAFSKNQQLSDIIGLYALAGVAKEFLAVSSNGKVSIWQLTNGQEKVLFPPGEPVAACAYHPGRNLLGVSQDTGVYLYDLNLMRRLPRSPSFGTKSASLDFAPDGNSLLVGGEDGRIYRWRLRPQENEDEAKRIQVERYVGHSAPVTSVAYHPFSRMFFSGDSVGSVAAWLTYDKDLFGGDYDERANETTYYTEHSSRAVVTTADATTILSMQISKDGQNIFAALQDGRVQWSLVRGLKLVILAQANKGAIYDMQLSPSGRLLATVARDGLVKVWKLVLLDKPGAVPGGKVLVDAVNDFKKDSIGYLSLVKEFPLAAARKLLFLSESTLVVGESGGRLLELSL